ncbi:hypothetical protein EV361DRAFT_916254 [Lentinula raphanica]|nr:hypothetical protein EV361DRAFT_916254 [Lentinula raphanica]
MVRARKPWLNRHIRRYIPPPEKLERDLKQLFDSFKNIVCSNDRKKGRGRFFSKESNKMADSLLDTVRRGFLSDPPGIPLYYIIGWDRDKLPLYRTIRGTNSIEGRVHMLIHRVFGSLRASPELTVSLLGNWILRRNQRVGHFNRTGKRWKSHFDIWLTDEIVEFAVLVGVSPSFRLPRMLVTRIATSESFGIIPIPSTLAAEYNISTLPPCRIEGVPHHRDTPAHLLTRLCTNPLNSYRYLQLCFRTVYPVLPVHTRAEYVEFKRSVGLAIVKTRRKDGTVLRASDAWKGIDYVKFAQIWNSKVDAQDPTIIDSNKRIYYKLPEQLLRHHKKSLERQASQATMVIESNAVLVQAHIDSVKDSRRVACVLPAVPLEDLSSQPDLAVDGIRGLDVTSFNPMAIVHCDINGNEHLDSQFEGVVEEPDPTLPALDDIAREHPHIDSEEVSSTGPGSVVSGAGEKSSTEMRPQVVLSFGNVAARMKRQSETQERPAKRRNRICAVCYDHQCSRAEVCNGRGGWNKCYSGICNHPNIGNTRIRRKG